MPKKAKELRAVDVAKIFDDGDHAVGGVPGLYLHIKDGRRSWILRAVVDYKRREIGLGRCADISLAEARYKAYELQKQIKDGINPIAERQKAQAKARVEAVKAKTFKDCVAEYVAAHHAAWAKKTARRWSNTLPTYVYPVFGGLPVADIDIGHILGALTQPISTPEGSKPLWEARTETASKLRGQIEVVLDWARVRGYRTGENPARWQGNLKFELPTKSKVQKVRHFPALPYTEIGAFMAGLRKHTGMAARALELAILTAVRSEVVRLATWEEIDLAARVWTVPALHMKMEREHYVPLSDAAVKLLEGLPRYEGNDHIFPPPQAVEYSDMALLMVIRRMHELKLAADGKGWIDPKQDNRTVTVHGFRSTFRDWAGETTSHPREVTEHALAHSLPDKTEAAYQRGTLIDKRISLMDDWARYCMAVPAAKGSNVVSIRKAV